jgi:SAM-dependent methyltransferase
MSCYLCAAVYEIDGIGEEIPLQGGSVDLVYARQVLHHAASLPEMIKECARVLSPGGILFACREHVADNEAQRQKFLKSHPTQAPVGGENAFKLSEYRGAGLSLELVLGPFDSVINAYPGARNSEEVARLPAVILRRKLGLAGAALAYLPVATGAVRWLLRRRPTPGRLYSFLAWKPR